MVKQHIHHFNRGVVIGFEFLGLIAFAVFVAWLYLIIRLSQGPMDVDFLTRRIERGLNSQQAGYEFNLGSTRLTWGGSTQPFVFEVSNVQVMKPDKTPVLAVGKIGIQLSKRYLVFGKFVPRVIKIYSPALKIVRGDDRQFKMNLTGDTPESGGGGQGDFIRALLSQMKDSGDLDFLEGLEQLSITDAALAYEDQVLNVSWKSKNSDVVFTRRRGGLLVEALANMEMDQNNRAYMKGTFYYNWQSGGSSSVLYFTGLNPALVAGQSEQMKELAGINLPLKGSVSFELLPDFSIGSGRFVLGSDPGTFNARALYQKPIPVKKMYAQGRFNVSTRELLLEQLRLETEGPKIEAKAALLKQDAGHHLKLGATMRDMPLDAAKTYWPEQLGVDARTWVVQHLSGGVATKSTLNLEMLAPEGNFDALQVKSVGGRIDFNGIKTDYFPPMPAAGKVGGFAIYDHKSFIINVTEGTLEDMRIRKGKVAMTDLDVHDAHAKIEINAQVTGPVRTALEVVDSEPLKYPKKMGISSSDAGGDADIDVTLSFPLYNHVKMSEINVKTRAQLSAVALKNAVFGEDFAGGPLDFLLDDGKMTIKGGGSIGGSPVDFRWTYNFSGAESSSKIDAKLSLGAERLVKMGVPAYFTPGGAMVADLSYAVAKDQSATLDLKGDIKSLSFAMPIASYEKKADTDGKLDLLLGFNRDKKISRASIGMETAADQVKGSLEFSPDGQFVRKADFEKFKLGATDITLHAEYNANDGYMVKVSGEQFDASKLISGDGKPNTDEEANKMSTPMTLSFAVNRFMTGTDKSIDQVQLYMKRNAWSRIDQLDVVGVSGGKQVALHYTPKLMGHALKFEADNAGAALSALGISNGIRGGKLVVTGQPMPKGGRRDMQGTLVLTDFTAVDIPALGRLLNAMSLTGIVELLKGKGIAFKKMKASFFYIDKGMPESDKNVRLIRLKDGETSGASLGLTFDGTIDNWAETLDLHGTIIPVSDVNKLVSSIPLVGDILTGGKGVFAATYKVKGPKSDPEASVNPLSVLAPGIFRKLFFEK